MIISIPLKKVVLFLRYDYKFIVKINLFHLTVEISPDLSKSIVEKVRKTGRTGYTLCQCLFSISIDWLAFLTLLGYPIQKMKSHCPHSQTIHCKPQPSILFTGQPRPHTSCFYPKTLNTGQT